MVHFPLLKDSLKEIQSILTRSAGKPPHLNNISRGFQASKCQFPSSRARASTVESSISSVLFQNICYRFCLLLCQYTHTSNFHQVHVFAPIKSNVCILENNTIRLLFLYLSNWCSKMFFFFTIMESQKQNLTVSTISYEVSCFFHLSPKYNLCQLIYIEHLHYDFD